MVGSEERKKGAPGPREGQKSTSAVDNLSCELSFCPLHADLGNLRGSSLCPFDPCPPIPTWIT